MPLSFKPFPQIDANDLQRLQINSVPEGLRIDYKRDYYGSNEGREFLKDLSSFANSQGGYLVIGAEEENGLIKSLNGVDSAKSDEEILRLENWARDGLEPRIVGIQMRRIDLPNKNSAIAIAIPKSMSLPHRVSSQNTNRFFVRNSNGKHEASVEELRQLFGYSARLTEEIQRFIQQRRKVIVSGEDIVPDLGNGRLIVHVVNAPTFGDATFVDVKRLYSDPYRFSGSGGLSRRMILEGVLVGSESDGKFSDRTIINRDGSIETVYSKLHRQRSDYIGIPGRALIGNIVGAVEKSLNGLLNLGGSGPFLIGVALHTSKGMSVVFDSYEWQGTFDRSFVEFPLLTILQHDASSPIPNAIRPLLDNVWNSVGFPECRYFQGDVWKPSG